MFLFVCHLTKSFILTGEEAVRRQREGFVKRFAGNHHHKSLFRLKKGENTIYRRRQVLMVKCVLLLIELVCYWVMMTETN